MLVGDYRLAKGGDGDDKEIRVAIDRAIDSSPSLRNKKDLMEALSTHSPRPLRSTSRGKSS